MHHLWQVISLSALVSPSTEVGLEQHFASIIVKIPQVSISDVPQAYPAQSNTGCWYHLGIRRLVLITDLTTSSTFLAHRKGSEILDLVFNTKSHLEFIS